MQDAHAPTLSVIIPMYREALRIEPTLRDVIETLRSSGRRCEIVLVDDGSTDDTVARVSPYLSDEPDGPISRVTLVSFDENRGKGAAVRAGLDEARGDWLLMMDADNAARVGEVGKLLSSAEPGVGLVAGSRSVAASDVEAKGFRRLTGLAFKSALWLLGLRLMRDTQCGFKLYRADVADMIVRHGVEDGFTFDLEHLLLTKRSGAALREVGIRWKHVDGGQINPVFDGLRMVARAARIRFRDYGVVALSNLNPAKASSMIEPKSSPAVAAAHAEREQ